MEAVTILRRVVWVIVFYATLLVIPSCKCAIIPIIKVKVTLRLVVYRQSVCLGIKSLETHNQRFFTN
jgi:hypothetical protein